MVPVQLNNYIEVRSVISPTHYFYVKKGLYNVRMVYYGTGCVLNGSIWAQHLRLPTVWHMLCSLLPGYSQGNLDTGEMFPNFLLNGTIKEMSGVDMKHVRSREISDLEWEMGRLNG